MGFSNKNAVTNIISWSKCIKLGMNPDYFKEYQIFVLYASDTSAWIFAVVRVGLYVCYTRERSSVELSSHFVRVHDVVAVSKVAQNTAKYTKREVQAATLAKQFRERMGLVFSRCAYDMINDGMIEDCPVSTHDLYGETAIWNKTLGDLKGKKTRRSPEEI